MGYRCTVGRTLPARTWFRHGCVDFSAHQEEGRLAGAKPQCVKKRRKNTEDSSSEGWRKVPRSSSFEAVLCVVVCCFLVRCAVTEHRWQSDAGRCSSRDSAGIKGRGKASACSRRNEMQQPSLQTHQRSAEECSQRCKEARLEGELTAVGRVRDVPARQVWNTAKWGGCTCNGQVPETEQAGEVEHLQERAQGSDREAMLETPTRQPQMAATDAATNGRERAGQRQQQQAGAGHLSRARAGRNGNGQAPRRK